MFNKPVLFTSLLIFSFAFATPPWTSAQTAAPASDIKRQVLQKLPLSQDSSKEYVMMVVEFGPGAVSAAHTHPGDEISVVTEGELVLFSENGTERTVKAGDSYHNAAGLVHGTRNVSQAPAKIIATYVVEKGKPLSTPAKR